MLWLLLRACVLQVEEGALEPLINYVREETSDLIGRQVN